MYVTLYNEFLKSDLANKLPDECLDKILNKLKTKPKSIYKAFIF